MFAGRIRPSRGPHVARGPDVAQEGLRALGLQNWNTGFPRYSRGLRSWKIVIREYQNSCFKPKIG